MTQQVLESTTQTYLDIHDITDDVLILKDGSSSIVVTVNAMNFGLLAEPEQDAIMYSYAGLLNSLNYSIQVVIRSQTKDVTSYLNLLKEEQEKSTNDVKRGWIERYRSFVADLIKERNVLDKKFYVVISASSLEMGLLPPSSVIPGTAKVDLSTVERSVILDKAKEILEPRRDHLLGQFGRIGLYGHQLTTQELIQLFYLSYNPEAAEGQQITDTQSYTTPLVQASVQGGIMDSSNQTPKPATDSAPSSSAPAATPNPTGTTPPASPASPGVPATSTPPSQPSQPTPAAPSSPSATPSAPSMPGTTGSPAQPAATPSPSNPAINNPASAAKTPATPSPVAAGSTPSPMTTPPAPVNPNPTTPAPKTGTPAASAGVKPEPAMPSITKPSTPGQNPPTAKGSPTPAATTQADGEPKSGDPVTDNAQNEINSTLKELGSIDSSPTKPAATPTGAAPTNAPTPVSPGGTANQNQEKKDQADGNMPPLPEI